MNPLSITVYGVMGNDKFSKAGVVGSFSFPKELFRLYHEVIGKLINMGNNHDKWVIKTKK